jgi:hypothetical protein
MSRILFANLNQQSYPPHQHRLMSVVTRVTPLRGLVHLVIVATELRRLVRLTPKIRGSGTPNGRWLTCTGLV